jgi:rhamnosyltransferase
MIAAVIVLYHPDLTLLERLLASLGGQADRVVAIDNTPGSSATLAPFLERFQCAIAYIPVGDNKGIAEAQNIGIRESIKAGCSHVLLLDQDSVLSPGMVDKLIAAEGELLKAGIKVGAVGPRYVDGKTDIPSFAIRYGAVTVRKIALDPLSSMPVETDILIASGSIIRTATLQTVGIMRGDLFIDLVDTEWALRARSNGYKNYCIPSAIMMHSVGDAAIKVFGKSVYLHRDLRKYYRLRNAMYLLQVSSMGWQWRSYILRWIPYYLFLSLWTSEHKLSNARLLLNALWDGLLRRLGPARQYQGTAAVSLGSSVSYREGR